MNKNPYSGLVGRLQDLNLKDSSFTRRLNELISINELLTTLNTAKTLEETLEIILLTFLGQWGCRNGAIFIKANDEWRMGMEKGLRNKNLSVEPFPLDDSWNQLDPIIRKGENAPPAMEALLEEGQFQMVLPAWNENKLTGLICLGRSLLGAGEDKELMLATIADFGGVLIGNSLFREDLETANRMLQRQIFQLNTLYEITGSFARCYENDDIFQILANNLMGQFFISRCAVLTYDQEEGLQVIFSKGLKGETAFENTDRHPLESWATPVCDKNNVPCPAVSAFMASNRLQYVLPISSEGKHEGLLCLGARLDRKPLTEADREFVGSISQQSAVAMENVRLQKEALEKKRMEKELQLAREIQQKLLPKSVPSLAGYELAVEMRPYYQVGGDFYDFIDLGNGRLCFCLADVSGKSLPASMIMSTAQASLRALNSFQGQGPKEVIEKLNLHMYHSTQSNKFISMFYGLLDANTHRLSYINAGHNRPILISPDHSCDLLSLGGMVVGLFPMAQYQVGEVTLDAGSDLLVYSDGLSEVTDKDGEEYGDDRLAVTLGKCNQGDTAEETKQQILDDVMNFSSNTMVDDMTLLLLRRKGTQ